MSVKAMTWAWKQETKTQGEKLVLLKLADCANDQGVCYPGVQTIMDACGLSKTGVINILKSLVAQNLISSERRYVEFGRRTSNLYTLPLGQPSVLNDSQCSGPDESLGQQSVPPSGQVDGPLGQPSVPEPSGEPSGNNPPCSPPKRRTRKAPPDFVVTDDMRAWAAENVPAVDVDFETAKFRDHEFAAPKSDWRATWRNWLRNAKGYGNEKTQRQGKTAYQRTMSAIDEWERSQGARIIDGELVAPDD